MEEWKTYKYTDLCTLIGGGTPKTSEPLYWNGDIPWLSVKDFGTGFKYVYSSEKHISEEGLNNSSTKLLQKDDIIISARGTVGVMAMIPFPMAFNQSCFGIRANNNVDPHFLYYLTKTKITELQSNSHGSVFDTITRDTFDKIDCSIPSISTQRKIATILSNLDRKIELNNRINHNLEEQAQALYKSWFVDFEPFKDGKFVDSELGMIPEGWNVSPLGKIAEYRKKSINPQRFPNTSFHHFSLPAFDNSKEPEIQKGLEIMSNKFVVEEKMVLFSKLNPRIKRLWVLDNVPDNAICSTEFIAYKAINQEMFSYVWCYLNGDSFYDSILSMVNGATGSHQRFHAEDTLNFIVPFSHNVAISFSKLVAPILYSIMKNERENLSLKQERDILLPKMMSGALHVDD